MWNIFHTLVRPPVLPPPTQPASQPTSTITERIPSSSCSKHRASHFRLTHKVTCHCIRGIQSGARDDLFFVSFRFVCLLATFAECQCHPALHIRINRHKITWEILVVIPKTFRWCNSWNEKHFYLLFRVFAFCAFCEFCVRACVVPSNVFDVRYQSNEDVTLYFNSLFIHAIRCSCDFESRTLESSDNK